MASGKQYLLIDNYDSFTYNLFHYLGELGEPVTVVRNDRISAEPWRFSATPRRTACGESQNRISRVATSLSIKAFS